MVDMQLSNNKLVDRSTRPVMDELGAGLRTGQRTAAPLRQRPADHRRRSPALAGRPGEPANCAVHDIMTVLELAAPLRRRRTNCPPFFGREYQRVLLHERRVRPRDAAVGLPFRRIPEDHLRRLRRRLRVVRLIGSGTTCCTTTSCSAGHHGHLTCCRGLAVHPDGENVLNFHAATRATTRSGGGGGGRRWLDRPAELQEHVRQDTHRRGRIDRVLLLGGGWTSWTGVPAGGELFVQVEQLVTPAAGGLAASS